MAKSLKELFAFGQPVGDDNNTTFGEIFDFISIKLNLKMGLRILFSLGLFSLIFCTATSQQEPDLIAQDLSFRPIAPIAPIKGHYKELQNLSTSPDPTGNEIDAIEYPSKAYGWISSILRPAYINKKQLKELYLKLNLPANSSKQTRAGLDFLLELQESRTEKQVKEVLLLNDIIYIPLFKTSESDLFYICSKVMETEITSTRYPHTKRLLHNIMKEARIVEFRAKNHFMRARPWQLESRLQPLKKVETPSFASGHTLWAYMQSYILAELIPDKSEDFINLAYEIGYSRELMGVHYPSDEEAARQLAYKVVEAMWATKKFQKDFKLAKAEWSILD